MFKYFFIRRQIWRFCAVYNLYRLKYLFSYDKIIFASFWRICLNFRLTGHNRQNKIDISEYIIMGSDYMPVPFDSRKIYYRSPFCAVEQGTEIHFRILLPKAEHTQKAHLCVKYDYDCNWEFTELIWCGKFDEDTEIWECDFTPKKSDFIGITLSLLPLIKQDMLFRPIRIRSAPLKTIWAEAGRLPATKKALKLPAGLSAELCIRFFPTVFISAVKKRI